MEGAMIPPEMPAGPRQIEHEPEARQDEALPPIRKIDVATPPRLVEPTPSPFGERRRRAAGSPSAADAVFDSLESQLETPPPEMQPRGEIRMHVRDFGIAYSGKSAVKDVNLEIRQGEVLALIGPSGCGKTTLLRSLNRLTELTETASFEGEIHLDDTEIHTLDANNLRKKISMVFQQPNPFPMSVFDNVAYALREQGAKRPSRDVLQPAVVEALERAGLVDEVKDDLNHPALRLSGGQQQRLCIARALAAMPEVILLDEPCSALDPKSTQKIEELIVQLKEDLAVVIVTHNMQQAYRVADYVAFMYLGELVEYGPVDQIFKAPTKKRTVDYIAGAFG